MVIALATLACTTAGCANIGAPRRSESLIGLDPLVAEPDGVRTRRSTEVKHYEEACVSPQRIGFDSTLALDEAERKPLRDEIANTLRARFSDAGLRVCEAPSGPTALDVRVLVKAVERASPGINAVTALLFFVPLSRGGITLEFEALDAHTGHRVAAMAFHGRASVGDVGSAFSALGHAAKQAGIAATRFVAVVTGQDGR
ncbi:DUF3313 family protein [Thermomonas sp.]|uniref:DUF3313 family protein n=1 Tax=Thermomonas sp. TaxID=1971895 RepID=UPI0035B00BD9